MNKRRHLGISAPFLLALASSGATSGAQSQEVGWPQFGGPTRDFHCPVGELAESWPEGGPPVLWRRPLGDGYSGIVVDSDRIYTMYRTRVEGSASLGNEVILCADRASGETLWEHAYEVVTHASAQQFGDGPSGTPTLAGGKLITVGVGIDVHCLDKVTGEIEWSLDIMEEYDIPMPGRGYSPSPLVYGDLVIITVGGRAESNAIDDTPNLGLDGGAVIALDIETGDIIWAAEDFPGSKASPILIEFEGRTQVVVFMGNELAGLDPETGELLWRFHHPTDYGFNCTTPVFDGVDTLICTSSYNNWAEAVQLVKSNGSIEAKKKWSSRRLRIHFTNMLLVDGRLYGVHGMTRPGMLTCLDVNDGEPLWRFRGFPKANLLYAGGPFLIFDEDGDLTLSTFTDDGPEIHGQVSVAESHAFTAPTLVGSELFVRDRDYLTAFDLSAVAVAALRNGEGHALDHAQEELPENVNALLGEFETDSSGVEPSTVRVLLEGGRLCLDLSDDAPARLAYQADQNRWELVTDRTSGSSPRTMEFVRDQSGAVTGFILRSPRQPQRDYQAIH